MERKKGRLNLLEAIDFLDDTAPKGPIGPIPEATVTRGYPDDGTGVAGDDDMPPGNIVYGERYKRTPYFNRLTSFQDSWENDPDEWTWDFFDNSQGMEDFDNYSDTLKGMEDLFTKKQWKDVWKRMKNVPDNVVTRQFTKKGQPWRKGGEDQLGSGSKETYVDIDAGKDGQVKDTKLKTESLMKKINDITL